MNQTCEMARGQFALLIYGELSFDEEEGVESHLAECADCTTALERERELLAVFDQVAVEPSPALLTHCREELVARLAQEPAPAVERSAASGSPWWQRFSESFQIRVPAWAQPIGAVALLAAGFFGARLTPSDGILSPMGMLEAPGAARVRNIEPSANGQIMIVLDETRQRTVTGTVADAQIRQLLFEAVGDADLSVRQQTMEILARQVDALQSQQEVRDVLLRTMRSDPNVSVRRRAMTGLEPFAGQPEVRTALAQVLVSDDDPSARNDAIEMLLKGMTGSKVPMDRQVVGMLQESMGREQENAIIRQRVQNALELMNASPEIY